MKKGIILLLALISFGTFATQDLCEQIKLSYHAQGRDLAPTGLNSAMMVSHSKCMEMLQDHDLKAASSSDCSFMTKEIYRGYSNVRFETTGWSRFFKRNTETIKKNNLETALMPLKASANLLDHQVSFMEKRFTEDFKSIDERIGYLSIFTSKDNWEKLRKDILFHIRYQKEIVEQYKEISLANKPLLEQVCGIELDDPRGELYLMFIKEIKLY